MLNLKLSTRRVFIVGDASLFEEGITKLLSFGGTELLVSGAKYTDDPAFLEVITQNQPDVILLNESTALDSAHILNLLLSAPSLTALYIIIIRLNSNLVDVYEMPKRFVITRPCELVDVVQGNFHEM